MLLLALAPAAAHSAPARSLTLDSPGRRVRVTFGLDAKAGAAGVPSYSVSWRGKPVIERASLGLDLRPGGLLGDGLRVTAITRRSGDASYKVFPGKTNAARDHYTEATVSLEEQSPPRRRMDIVFRAYDDGAAFRYRIPRQTALPDLTLLDERSTFAFAGNPKAWTLPVPSYTSHYEFYYHPVPVKDVRAESLLAVPLLLEYPGGAAVAVTEADLTDYAGMYLGGTSSPGVLTSRLSPRLDDPAVMVKGALPHDTPWRVILLGDAPGRLIESNLVANLNPPSVIADTAWIRPGKTTFPWWNGFDSGDAGFPMGLDTRTAKYYIDFCARHGIPYHSLDGKDNIAWYGGTIVPYVGQGITEGLPGLDLPEVIAYAKQKGVRLRLWMNVGAARAHMKTAFPLYEKWGIEGVMIDMIERDDQETINFIRDLVALAAKHHLTVTLHNVSKPTGMNRTYPNLMTREAVLNLEYDKWDPKASTPEHEVTVPFTRMLAGPLDYHSGSFRNVTQERFKPQNTAPRTIGTRARQLARYVVYEDPLNMAADSPAAYEGERGLELLVSVPTTWDETKVLNGAVGRYITVARRSGKTWYVGAMTDGSAREFTVPLRFLGPGRYTAEAWTDDKAHPDEPARLVYRKKLVTSGDAIRASTLPAGGAVIRLTPR
jgi:alpha-glucosidase